MKALIQHFLRSNITEVLSKSLMNCHVKGLHSIMLAEMPGKTIRLYVTSKDHELWKNMRDDQSVAYHPHHCDLTLHCVFGSLANITVRVGGEAGQYGNFLSNKYLYHSAITEGKMGFEHLGMDILSQAKSQVIGLNEHIFMRAHEVHTVFCVKDTVNAWLVYEGKEDPNYKAYCWTSADLTNASSEGLYQKLTAQDLDRLMDSIGVPCLANVFLAESGK